MNSVHRQTVRMILIEHIQGITMADAKPRNFLSQLVKVL